MVVAAVVVVVAFVLQPLLSILLLLALPRVVSVLRLAVRRVRPRALARQASSDRFAADIGRALRAMTLTQVLGAGAGEVERQAVAVRALRREAVALADAQASAGVVLTLAVATSTGLLIVAGVAHVALGNLTPGTRAGFFAVVLVLTRQLVTVARRADETTSTPLRRTSCSRCWPVWTRARPSSPSRTT